MSLRKRLRKAALRLLRRHDGDRAHHEQVARLALETFDGLKLLHGLGRRERTWLECAALLHDIGRSEREEAHHKASYRMILESDELPLKRHERRIVGAVARYHTGALPSGEHGTLEKLSSSERKAVRKLSSFLRLADALDARHREAVDEVEYKVSRKRIVGRCFLRRAKPRLRSLLLRRTDDKGQLLERVFDRDLELKLKAA